MVAAGVIRVKVAKFLQVGGGVIWHDVAGIVQVAVVHHQQPVEVVKILNSQLRAAAGAGDAACGARSDGAWVQGVADVPGTGATTIDGEMQFVAQQVTSAPLQPSENDRYFLNRRCKEPACNVFVSDAAACDGYGQSNTLRAIRYQFQSLMSVRYASRS